MHVVSGEAYLTAGRIFAADATNAATAVATVVPALWHHSPCRMLPAAGSIPLSHHRTICSKGREAQLPCFASLAASPGQLLTGWPKLALPLISGCVVL